MPHPSLRPLLLVVAAMCLAAPAASAANTAIAPEARQALQPDPAWLSRHAGFVEIAKRDSVNVLFVGDSITDAWRRDTNTGGRKVWNQLFAPLGAANFGIGGDRTQHVLWRLENGELDGLKPKAIVLMIGTNNTGLERDTAKPRNTPAEVVEGVSAILQAIRRRAPSTKILLLAIFPRGEKPGDPQRLQIDEINPELAKLADGDVVRFLDIGGKFLAADGTLTRDIMYDFLHLSTKGYQIWGDAIKEPLAEMLR